MGDPGDGEADYVEVGAFDAGDEARGYALDGVGAGFVEGFAGGEVAVNVFSGELGEMDESGFDESAALGVGKTNERDAGEDDVGAARKLFEHVAGVVGGARLAEDVGVEGDDGVGGDDDGGANGASSDEFGFGAGEALDVILRRFIGEGSFVDGGREHGEMEAGVAQNVGAAGRGGGEDEFHGGGQPPVNSGQGENTTAYRFQQPGFRMGETKLELSERQGPSVGMLVSLTAR